jgi:UDPglucose 6-dehydrogenase
MKTGIIGYGFVGKAVAAAYDEVLIVDPAYPEISQTIDTLKQECNVIFICVPTPSTAKGDCDTRILEDTMEQLKGYTGLIISKSTATPNVYANLESKYSDLKFAHVPEFLTAANAVEDYLMPVKVLIGSKPKIRMEVFAAVMTPKIRYDMTHVQYCDVAEAAMYKYLANTMLAMKVIMNNEFYDLCQSLNVNYGLVASIAKTDPRLGDTHWAVPGPDGSRGFGGACFPKDTQALLNLAKFMNVDMSMLENAIDKNKGYRA